MRKVVDWHDCVCGLPMKFPSCGGRSVSVTWFELARRREHLYDFCRILSEHFELLAQEKGKRAPRVV